MCNVLQLPRATYYYEAKEQPQQDPVTLNVIEIFNASRQNYGTRKIKVELQKLNLQVSRRRIGRIMQEQGLVSSYTVAQYKPHVKSCNESSDKNELNRQFDQEEAYRVVVSDLTYVRVDHKWNYVCVFVDLFNRELIGYSSGPNKDAALVYRAISSITINLNQVKMFHTDRGNEFKNKLIDEALEAFGIQRSLSMKGCPYDNAVAEATFKTIKTEFVKRRHFESLEILNRELHDYVNWFNQIRIHETLGYLSPIEYKQLHLNKVV